MKIYAVVYVKDNDQVWVYRTMSDHEEVFHIYHRKSIHRCEQIQVLTSYLPRVVHFGTVIGYHRS